MSAATLLAVLAVALSSAAIGLNIGMRMPQEAPAHMNTEPQCCAPTPQRNYHRNHTFVPWEGEQKR